MDAGPLTPLAVVVFLAIAVAVGVLAYRVAWSAPAVLVATAPFAWYHQLGPTEITVSKAAFAGVALGVIASIARDGDRRRRAFAALRSNRALIPLAFLFLWSMTSALWAGTPPEAIRDAFKWLWYASVFALTVAAIEKPADAFKMLAVLFVTAAAVAIDGMWQNVTSAPAGFVAPNGAVVGRIAGTLEGPNQFGAYLESVIPPLLAILLFARLPRLMLVAGSVLLGLLCADLLLTYSRGALWACVGAIVFVFIVYARSQRESSADSFRRTATIVICAALVIVPVAHSSIGALGWQHELLTPTAPDTPDSTQRRRQLWTCAIELFARHPLTGVGAGNFADAKQECGAALAGPEHFNANEWYLETAADLGVAGLAGLVTFLVVLLLTGRRSVMWGDPAAIGAYAVLIAFILHGFADDIMAYPKAALSFFVLSAMLPPRET